MKGNYALSASGSSINAPREKMRFSSQRTQHEIISLKERHTMNVMLMANIAIADETRKALLRIAAEIQKEQEKRIDFDAAISFLIEYYHSQQKDKGALERFLNPMSNLSFEDAYAELAKGRKECAK